MDFALKVQSLNVVENIVDEFKILSGLVHHMIDL